MIEIAAALSAANAAFTAIKKGVAVGQDIENMAGTLGKWMGAVSDIKKAEEMNKNLLCLKNYLPQDRLRRRPWKFLWPRKKPRTCVSN